jgi:hypothetical protein
MSPHETGSAEARAVHLMFGGMRTPRPRILIGAGIACLLFVYWLAIHLPSRVPVYPPSLSVKVVGYTNAPDGHVLAQLVISNISPSIVMFWNPDVLIQTNGVWFTNRLTGTLNAPISAHKAVVVNVPKPPNVESWRIMVAHLRTQGRVETKIKNSLFGGRPLPRRLAITEELAK